LLVSYRRLQKQKSQPTQTDPCLIPIEDCFCRSETKHDRRTEPRLRVFSSKKITGAKATGLGPSEDGFSSSETKQDRDDDAKNFFFARLLQKLKSQMFESQ
jgi:hypothetical protein